MQTTVASLDAAITGAYLDSPIGRLTVLADSGGVREIHFPNNEVFLLPDEALANAESKKCLALAIEQLKAYFDGRLKTFDLPLSLYGTFFQRSVWTQLQKVAYGTTASYGQIASALDKPKAARAVGMANNKNRVPIVVPCHRIIGSNGSLTGFAGGLDTKRWLLKHEGISF